MLPPPVSNYRNSVASINGYRLSLEHIRPARFAPGLPLAVCSLEGIEDAHAKFPLLTLVRHQLRKGGGDELRQ